MPRGEIFTPPQTNMTMEQQPFEDVSPIGNGEFPASHVYRIYVWFRVRLSSGSQAMCQERVHLRLWDGSHWCSLSLGAALCAKLRGNFPSRWIPSKKYVKNRDGKPFKGLVLAILVYVIYQEKII